MDPTPASRAPSHWNPWLVALCLAAAALSAAHAVRLSLEKTFSIDEFQYAHAAWLIAKGQLPYRDFFEVHFPLVYQWLSLWTYARPESPAFTALALRVGVLPLLALSAVSVWRLSRAQGRLTAALAVTLLLSLPGYVTFATEIRPDPTAVAFLLAGLACCESAGASKRGRAWAFLSGLSIAAALWSSQKAGFYAAPLQLWLLVAAVSRRAPSPFRAPASTLAGLAVGALCVLGYLLGTGSAQAFWQWCFVWAAEHQRGYPGFPVGSYFLPVLRSEVPVFTLALLGLAGTLQALRAKGRGALESTDALLVLLLPFAFGSFALQRAPFPYSFTPLLALVALFAARAVPALRAISPLAGTATLAVLLCAVLGQHLRLESLLGAGNRGQLRTLERLAELTAPEDVVYDNSGGYIARPHAHFLFYTDAFIRASRVEQLNREIPQALIERGCVARLDDLRTEALPSELKRFLHENYQPVDGDLFLWGRQYALDGPLRSRFLAVARGSYFASREDGILEIDGTRVDPSRFELEPGWHDVAFSGSAGTLDILWLPRNGERWTPRRSLPPQFSRLF